MLLKFYLVGCLLSFLIVGCSFIQHIQWNKKRACKEDLRMILILTIGSWFTVGVALLISWIFRKNPLSRDCRTGKIE